MIHTIIEQESDMGYIGEIIGIIFKRDFIFKYKYGGRAFIYSLFAVISILLLPFFYLKYQNDIQEDLVFELVKNGYTMSVSKISELLPWYIIILTSLALIIANTLYYFWEYLISLRKSKIDEKFGPYKLSIIAYIIWGMVTLGACFIIYKNTESGTNLLSVEYAKFKYSQADTKDTIDEWLTESLIKSFEKVVQSTEIYFITIIIIFLFIDGFFIQSIRNKKQLTDEDKKNLDFAKNQFWLIDFAVLIGLILTLIYVNKTKHLQQVDKDAYLIFSVGVLAMHIVYSQMIFLLLNLRRLINEFTESIENNKTIKTIEPIKNDFINQLNDSVNKYTIDVISANKDKIEKEKKDTSV